MKYTFVIQGEGRGHISQAIALKEILHSAGHEVISVMVGKSKFRVLPGYLYKNFGPCQINSFYSPNFIKSQHNKGIMVWWSIFVNFIFFTRFLKSIRFISQTIKNDNADCVINFYEPMVGLVYWKYRPGIPHVTIAHQYIARHKDFPHPPKKIISKGLLFLLNRVTAFGACKVLALSFSDHAGFKDQRYILAPPLLRKKILDATTEVSDFMMVYILNHGFYNDIVKWHEGNREIKCVVFWDNPQAQFEQVVNENLIFYKINEELFIDHLRRCKGFISTAGFESICEAFYLNKSTVAIPVPGHYEQLCNAFDAEKYGAVKSLKFNLPLILNNRAFAGGQYRDHQNIKKWCLQARAFYLRELTNIFTAVK